MQILFFLMAAVFFCLAGVFTLYALAGPGGSTYALSAVISLGLCMTMIFFTRVITYLEKGVKNLDVQAGAAEHAAKRLDAMHGTIAAQTGGVS